MVAALKLYDRSGPEAQVGAAGGPQSLPKLAWISASQYILVWVEAVNAGSTDTEVRARLFDADGSPAGAPFAVNAANAGVQTHAVVAKLAGGGFVVAWESHEAGASVTGDYNGSIRFQLFDAAGQKVGSEGVAGTSDTLFDSSPSIAGLEGGGFVLTWSDAPPTFPSDGTSDLNVHGQLFSATGAALGSDFLVNTATYRDQTAPSAVGLPGGGFAVVWQDGTPQGNAGGPFSHADYGTDIMVQVFDAAGAKLGGAQDVDQRTPSPVFTSGPGGRLTAINPVATVLADGRIAVAWVDAGDGVVRTRILNSDGSPAGAVFDVGLQTGTKSPPPAIATLADGGFVVTWTAGTSTRTDGDGQRVLARAFDAAGSPQGAAFQANAPGILGDHFASTVIASPDLGFRIAWQDKASGQVTAQLFSPDAGVIHDIALSANAIADNAIENLPAATLSADGAVNDVFAYQLLNDPTGAFRIEGDRLVVADTLALHGFAGNEAVLTLRVTDANGNSYDEDVHVPLVATAVSPLYAAGREFSIAGGPAGAPQVNAQEIVALPDGRLFATWTEATGASGQYQVMGRFLDADGAAGAAFVINTVAGRQNLEANAVVLANGNLLVTWSDLNTRFDWDVKAQLLSPAGAKVGGEFLVNTVTEFSQTGGQPIALRSGGFLVTWSDGSQSGADSDGAIKAQLFAADGSKLGAEFLVNTTTQSLQIDPSAAELSSGNIVIAWSDYSATGADGSAAAIRAQIFTAAGARIGAEFLVNTTTLFAQTEPVVAALPGGRFIIAWRDTSEGSGSNGVFDPADIRAQIYDAEGHKVGGEILVNTLTAGEQGGLGNLGAVDIAVMSSGQFVIAWDSFGAAESDGDPGAIKAQLFDYDGNKVGGEFLVDPVGDGQQSYGDVAYLANGDLAFSYWEVNSSPEGLTFGMSGRRFHLVQPPQTVLHFVDGGAQNDSLEGTAGDDVVTGYDGSDFLHLEQGGNDRAQMGDGNDAVYFGAAMTSADKVDGGAGKDVVALQGNYAGLTLGAGSLTNVETLTILPHTDARFGGGSASGFSYVVTLLDAAVAGGTQLIVNASTLEAGDNLTIDGHLEADASFFIYGGKGVDTLTGGGGADVFFFAEDGRFGANDHIDGGAGSDIVVLRGNYDLTLTAGSIVNVETVTLMSGTDARFYAAGTDFSYAIATDDTTVAAGQAMTFNGGGLRATETFHFDGSAELDGGAYRVFGGAADDVITGGNGNDLIFGGLGADLLKGGGGSDTFRYQGMQESTGLAMDRILDFASGDHIEMARAGHFAFIGSDGFGGHAGELRVEQQGSSNVWLVQADADGDGSADFVLQVTVADNHQLTASDFVF